MLPLIKKEREPEKKSGEESTCQKTIFGTQRWGYTKKRKCGIFHSSYICFAVHVG
jgi:hypothetical protein